MVNQVKVKLYFHFLVYREVIVSLLVFASQFIFCNTPLIPWASGAVWAKS